MFTSTDTWYHTTEVNAADSFFGYQLPSVASGTLSQLPM